MKNMKKIFITSLCLFLVCGCKDVKLENGDKAIVTFNEGGISAQELYTELKNQYGGEKITELIDSYLLNKLYKTDSEEKDYVKQAIKTTKKSAEEIGLAFNTYIKSYYNVTTEDELYDYFTLNYKRTKWLTDYAKKSVSEKQIKEYYESYIYGDVEASQILITIDVKDDASDEEKTEAENKALELANEIIKKLDSNEDFATLAKDYSKDETSSKNGGSLGKVNDGDLAEEALSALRELKDGTYTKTPVKSSYGYHILYRKSMDEKPELNDEIEDKIRTKVGAELEEEDGFGGKAILALREENGMKFVDTDLEKLYENAK